MGVVTIQKPSQSELVEQVARIAAQLARERASRLYTIPEIARDAIALARAGTTARRNVGAGRDASGAYADAADILNRYGAECICRGDIGGLILGAKFASGTYRCGFRDIFHIA